MWQKLTNMRNFLFMLCLLSLQLGLHAQTGNKLFDQIVTQVRLFPQETTYVFTDAESYQSGQRISLRVFVVDAVTHQLDSMSHYVYVELISPDNIVLRRIRLLRSDQGFVGYFDLPDHLNRGRYLLRSYTKNMMNVKGYESVKSIFVNGEGKLLSEGKRLNDTKVINNDKRLIITKEKDLIKLSLNDTSLSGGYWLLGHCRSIPFFFGKISRGKDVYIHCDSLQQGGIHNFLLLDANLKTIEQRMTFLSPSLEACKAKVVYTENVETTDGELPCLITANLHPGETMDIALRLERISNDSAENHANILTHLLVDTDKQGAGETPLAILRKGDVDAQLQGGKWSRYNLADVLAGKITEPRHEVETSGRITGRVKTLFGNRPIKNGTVNLLSPNRGFCAATTTNESGQYSFDNIDFPEGTQYVLNAFTKNGKKTVRLQVDEDNFPPFSLEATPFAWLSRLKAAKDSLGDIPKGSIQLEGVEVSSYRPTYASRSDAYARTADFSFGLRDIEEIGATCLHELLRRVPSVSVEFGKCYVRGGVTIGEKRPAAIAIDGVFTNDDYDLDNIQMTDVERVDVFKTGSTVIWGAIGGFGVISITTKKGNYNPSLEPLSNTKAFTTLGYQVPEMYIPSYRTPLWLPSLRGTSFRLMLPLVVKSGYRLRIEGITSEGRIVTNDVE